jgi:putative ABC transport system permease protein
MFKNLFKIAIRNLVRDISYSLINILGLTIGITGSLFLILYVYDELSFDRYHENANRICRISSRISEPDDAFNWAVSQVPLAPQIKQDYPEVEESTRLIGSGKQLYKYEETELFEEEVMYADSTFFKVFKYSFIEGNPETALIEPNTIVLTRSFAERYFGKESPVGKSLEREDKENFTVTGLIEDIPSNTHFTLSALISRTTLPAVWGSWGAFHIYTYILLQEGADPDELEAKLPEMYDNYMAEIFERMGIHIVYDVMPITTIHLHSDFEGEPVQTGNMNYVYIFLVVTILLLIIASINYMNLATARSTKRSKEVGLRKVVGSSRGALIRQFLSESVILTLIALLISLLLIYLFLPQFNNISGKHIEIDFLLKPAVLISLLGVVLFTGLVGGSYPSFFLSSFNPIAVLRGQMQMRGSNISVRKLLVIFQFTLSTAMIISTWIVFDQLNYLKNKDVGFDKENVVLLRLTSREQANNLGVFRESLESNPRIFYVGLANSIIGNGSGKSIHLVETKDGMVERGINTFRCDHNFIPASGITLLQGRNFSLDFPGDTATAVIINETLAKRLNWDEPLGKRIQLGGDTTNVFSYVVGVIKDYYHFGMYNEMESLMFLYYPECFIIYIKVDNQGMTETIQYIENQWNELYPQTPFTYQFLEESFNEQFDQDEKRGVVFTFFAILTVIIASLGLFGLASFISEQRTKEIGIRKVHGASVSNITWMMLRSFLVLVLIAIVVASAASYYFADNWLESFVHRTPVKWSSFVLASLLTVVLTILTVGIHTIRAGRLNPADSLRNE